MKELIPVEIIESKIYLIRGEKVMLDSDLAVLYEVKTFNLNKAVKRNIDRFPIDFMFQLTNEEAASLRFQIGMSKTEGRGGRRYLPYVFTEQGVAMLSTVLNSERAVKSILRSCGHSSDFGRCLHPMQNCYVNFRPSKRNMTLSLRSSLTLFFS